MTFLKRRTAVVMCLLMLAGTPVVAGSFCEGLQVLAEEGDARVPLMLPNGTEDQQADCRTTLSLGGGRDLNCNWSFAYRSEAALAAFESVIAEVTECLGPDAVQSTDQQVNHPDAYDLRMFQVDGQEFAVSLKDKGALQQTLIFLRVPIAAKP